MVDKEAVVKYIQKPIFLKTISGKTFTNSFIQSCYSTSFEIKDKNGIMATINYEDVAMIQVDTKAHWR